MTEQQPTAEEQVAAPHEGPAPEAAPLEEQTPAEAAAAPEDVPAAQEEPVQEQAPADEDKPAVGPKILGVAPEPKPLPVVKKKLVEKPAPPKREPLPFPELRTVVALVREETDVAELKELYRLLPAKVRDEVTEGVREFRKGARRPLSQHAAKSLARAVHTARRQKKNARPNPEVGEAIAQAIIGELVASLDVEVAAEVILPKRDLLDRAARAARRRAKDEEDKRRDEWRRKKREDSKGMRGQTSFGQFSGTKIKGLDEIAAAFGVAADEPEPAAAPETETETEETAVAGYSVPPEGDEEQQIPDLPSPEEAGDLPQEIAVDDPGSAAVGEDPQPADDAPPAEDDGPSAA
ncbi:MAG TPA: hypothetical protein VD931_09030 [Baekduia sp.]|nr:hypothetical protein [Baekduia sp.]